MTRIVICGYMIRHPVAGNLLAFFHYLLGFSRLGYQVVYLEESGWPLSCYNPMSGNYSDDPILGIQSVRGLLSRFKIKADVGFINRESGETWGLAWDEIKQALSSANVLLNIGGVCWLPDFTLCKRLALIDMDPFFTQVGKFASEGLNDYHFLFSYGTNIGQADCLIPTNGRKWISTVPPVVPEIWQSCQSKLSDEVPFTTIANWNAYGSVSYHGKKYGQKREEFLKLLSLPGKTKTQLELALSGVNSQDRQLLEVAGWQVRDSDFTESFDHYQTFITQSRGEFSVAKNAYVATRSGWFSDRSVCYLASGLPAILQDTGFTARFNLGSELLTFSTLDDAAECLDRVNSQYSAYCQAAEKVVDQVFSYRIVLPRLLNIILQNSTQFQIERTLGGKA